MANCIVQQKYLARKEKGNENKINKSDIVKYVRVSKSAPCITVARHGLGEFFGEEGNISLSNKKLFVNLLLQNLNVGDLTGDQGHDKDSGGGYLKSPEQVSLETGRRIHKIKEWQYYRGMGSVASEGASEVICLVRRF